MTISFLFAIARWITQSGRQLDFTSADFFRIEDGLAAEHWDTVDYVRL